MNAINISNFKYRNGTQDCQWFAEALMQNPGSYEDTLNAIVKTKEAQDEKIYSELSKIWKELWRY